MVPAAAQQLSPALLYIPRCQRRQGLLTEAQLRHVDASLAEGMPAYGIAPGCLEPWAVGMLQGRRACGVKRCC